MILLREYGLVHCCSKGSALAPIPNWGYFSGTELLRIESSTRDRVAAFVQQTIMIGFAVSCRVPIMSCRAVQYVGMARVDIPQNIFDVRKDMDVESFLG